MTREVLLNESIEVVRRYLPAFEPTIERCPGYLSFGLPIPEDAECRFFVYLYSEGEPQIAAEPVSREASFFWYYAFELPDFDSPQHQATAFLAELDRVLTADTKIIERQGFLWLSYTCLIAREKDWCVFGTKPSLLAPRLHRRRREYRSPRIASAGGRSPNQ